MTNSELLRIAKKASCRCCICKCTMKNLAGKPVFGNNKNDCKIDINGNTYCSYCASVNSVEILKIPEWIESDRISDPSEKNQIINSMNTGSHFECYSIGEHIKYRAMKEGNDSAPPTIFVYGKRRRNRGYRYSINVFLSKYDLKADKSTPSENEKWHKRINRAIKLLEESGLWPEILTQLKNLSKMTWEDRKEIGHAYMDHWSNDPTPVYNKFLSKYPFVFRTTDEGKIDVNTFYIYEMSDVILKPMYFGKYHNEGTKELIKERIRRKEDYSTTARTSYDVSFEYKAELNSAWYSEEYKGCGNGHYWIAIDHSTAMFCEND